MRSITGTYVFHAILCASLWFPLTTSAQKELLRQQISTIATSIDGKVGVAVIALQGKDTLTFNGSNHYPMQSVFKFPLAMAVLSQIDKGNLKLNQLIHLTTRDLLPNTFSPLRDRYPNANVDITISELLTYTVSESDNNACDILFRQLGGPKKVNQYVHSLGLSQIEIAATEEEMHKTWNVQFQNWTTPMTMARLLEIFEQGKHLSSSSTLLLQKLMTETPTGANRIKGLLPKGTLVMHKTGSSGTNDRGLIAASNDVGIVTLKNGKHVVIVVLVSNTTAGAEKSDAVIAGISKVVWDYYSNR